MSVAKCATYVEIAESLIGKVAESYESMSTREKNTLRDALTRIHGVLHGWVGETGKKKASKPAGEKKPKAAKAEPVTEVKAEVVPASTPAAEAEPVTEVKAEAAPVAAPVAEKKGKASKAAAPAAKAEAAPAPEAEAAPAKPAGKKGGKKN